MKVILGLPKKKILYRVVAAIGVFDGIHLGHKFLISQAQKKASELKAKTLVITFWPHPQDFLNKKFGGYLTNLQEKIYLLEGISVDYLWVIKFNQDFYAKDGLFFIRHITKFFRIQKVIVGEDFNPPIYAGRYKTLPYTCFFSGGLKPVPTHVFSGRNKARHYIFLGGLKTCCYNFF